MRNNPSIMNDIIPIDSEVTTFSEYSQREFERTRFPLRRCVTKYDCIALDMGFKQIEGVIGLGKCYKVGSWKHENPCFSILRV